MHTYLVRFADGSTVEVTATSSRAASVAAHAEHGKSVLTVACVEFGAPLAAGRVG